MSFFMSLIRASSALMITLVVASCGVAFAKDPDVLECEKRSVVMPDIAILYCDRALKKAEQLSLDDNIAALLSRAQAYFKKKDYGRAIADYERTMKLYPYDTSVLEVLGMAHARNGDHRRAIAIFDKVLGGDDKPDFTTLFARGISKLKVGDTDAGNRDIAEARRLDAKKVLDDLVWPDDLRPDGSPYRIPSR